MDFFWPGQEGASLCPALVGPVKGLHEKPWGCYWGRGHIYSIWVVPPFFFWGVAPQNFVGRGGRGKTNKTPRCCPEKQRGGLKRACLNPTVEGFTQQRRGRRMVFNNTAEQIFVHTPGTHYKRGAPISQRKM